MAPLLPSFFIGGFEASMMRRSDGRRNDLVEATRHEELAASDYELLLSTGMKTAREGTAWHRIEERPGRFDPGSVINRVRAADTLGLQLIWDLCHFGWPDDVDPFAADFPDRLARFARWFATLLHEESGEVPWYVPVNEPSFVAWAAGDVGYLNPFERGRGDELKRQLVRAAIAAAAAVRDVDPRARICHVDPTIHIEPGPNDVDGTHRVARHNEAQFHAWDMLGGRLDDELGGSDAQLDVIGVNFYDRNQWIDGGPILGPGDPGHRALRDLLADIHARYHRPIIVAETGTEGAARVSWLRYVCDEVAESRAAGIPVEGVCIYPVIDYPGWDDDRHVEVGLWGYADANGFRPPYRPLIEEVERQIERFAAPDPRNLEAMATPASLGPAETAAATAWSAFMPAATRPRWRSFATTAAEPPLDICLVTDSRDPSGVGHVMVTLGRGLAARGNRVVIAAPEAVDARWLLEEAARSGIEAWSLPDASPWAQAAELRARLASDPIDVVNVHAGIGWEGHPAVAAASSAGSAVVRTEHLPFLLTKPRDRDEYFVGAARAAAFIAVSEGVARSFLAAGVADTALHVVHNGIDEPVSIAGRDRVRGALGVDANSPLVTSVGRLTAQKGYDVLLAAAARLVQDLPRVRFVIVGTGLLERELHAELEALDLRGVVRRVARWADVPSLLAASDLVALASRFEGLPLVALEAMAVRRPVVGTRVCGIDEAVVDGVTGRVVDPDDPEALAGAMREVLGAPALAREYGVAGRERYEARFTTERMVRDTEAVYRGVLRSSSSQRRLPRRRGAGQRRGAEQAVAT